MPSSHLSRPPSSRTERLRGDYVELGDVIGTGAQGQARCRSSRDLSGVFSSPIMRVPLRAIIRDTMIYRGRSN